MDERFAAEEYGEVVASAPDVCYLPPPRLGAQAISRLPMQSDGLCAFLN